MEIKDMLHIKFHQKDGFGVEFIAC